MIDAHLFILEMELEDALHGIISFQVKSRSSMGVFGESSDTRA